MLHQGIFANPWWIVFGCVMGLLINAGVITGFIFSVFLKPITHDLGVNRANVGLALFVGTLLLSLGPYLYAAPCAEPAALPLAREA